MPRLSRRSSLSPTTLALAPASRRRPAGMPPGFLPVPRLRARRLGGRSGRFRTVQRSFTRHRPALATSGSSRHAPPSCSRSPRSSPVEVGAGDALSRAWSTDRRSPDDGAGRWMARFPHVRPGARDSAARIPVQPAAGSLRAGVRCTGPGSFASWSGSSRNGGRLRSSARAGSQPGWRGEPRFHWPDLGSTVCTATVAAPRRVGMGDEHPGARTFSDARRVLRRPGVGSHRR